MLADYEDKDGSAARRILDAIDYARRRKAAGEKDEDDEGGDSGIDKGPPAVSADQSGITGESLAVDKHIGDILYYTT